MALVRKKLFAVIKASTNPPVDLGLKLKGRKGDNRLKEAPGLGSGLITHKLALMSVEDVDEQVIGWINEAYGGEG